MSDIHFEKISYEEYYADYAKKVLGIERPLTKDEEVIVRHSYDNIILPVRGTQGSAGYDIVLPYDIAKISNGESHCILTGLRAAMPKNVVLLIMPRSGLGSKYGVGLRNTIGVIDSDYIQAANEGHIMLNMTTENDWQPHAGDKIAQGIFVPFLVTNNDDVDGVRIGGFGSTDNG